MIERSSSAEPHNEKPLTAITKKFFLTSTD